MKRERSLALLLLSLLVMAGLYYAWGHSSVLTLGQKGDVVVTLGQDLTEEQKQDILLEFGVEQKKQVRFLTISNQEERQTLGGLVNEDLIGIRAISSAYVELLDKSRGIEVETRNITTITPFMYANALITAGVSDARIKVAAPVPVSGTAALTGIIKGFESAKGQPLNKEAKDTAEQEIARTAKLGQKYGPQTAEKLIYEVKKEVVSQKVKDPQEIDKIVIQVSQRLNIELSQEDRQAIVNLMVRIASLNISSQSFYDQLRGLEKNLKEIGGAKGRIVDFFSQLMDLMNRWIAAFLQMLT